jgi:hypothetical protein
MCVLCHNGFFKLKSDVAHTAQNVQLCAQKELRLVFFNELHAENSFCAHKNAITSTSTNKMSVQFATISERHLTDLILCDAH